MIVLGIESSCDETAASVIETPNRVLSNLVASQYDVHAKFGGVVPELASRRHMEMVAPLVEDALSKSGLTLSSIDGIAATRAPGLIGAILVGLSFAKSLAMSLGKPFIGVNHLEGHLNAAFLEHDISYPYIGLVVSGGHTSLYLVKEFGNYTLLGATRDDAAGEAYDKVAKLLGLGYPGGPIIDRVAKNGNPSAFKFTRPKMSAGSKFEVGEFDFSFSGLKTQVMIDFKNTIGDAKPSEQCIADMAASFQHTVVEIITHQLIKACKKYSCSSFLISGGVAANSCLRARLGQAASENGLKFFCPSMKYCTDNAAMIAYVGAKRLEMGERSSLDTGAVANEEIGLLDHAT